jgi:hypothetical protein
MGRYGKLRRKSDDGKRKWNKRERKSHLQT